jgi:hypothetical protein
MTNKYLKAEAGPKNSVIYFDDKGRKWIFEKGSRAWRNQNPGNMVVGKRSRDNRMIGKAGGFAIFPDYAIGHRALLDLLLNEYGDFDLFKLMDKFAPPIQNNTKKYIQSIKKNTGVDEKVLIKNYSKIQFEKLWKSIELIEGWKNGTIKELSRPGEITKVKKNKKGKILSYLVDGRGWLSKQEAIQLTLQKKIDAVVVSRNGTKFLRSRPNKMTVDNLGNKV